MNSRFFKWRQVLVIGLSALFLSLQPSEAAIERQLFNFGWEYRTCIAHSGDTTAWKGVDLPHDFQFEFPWDKSAGGARGFKPMGEAWYRKTFTVPAQWEGKQVVLDFDGLMYYGDVYVNGVKLYSTDYGYVGFEVDMSKQLKYGQDNLVEVYSSTGASKGSRWYTGGGLIRDVYLELRNPTHISRHGIYVTTPRVSEESSEVSVQVEVSGWQGHDVTIKAELFDPDGQMIAASFGRMPEHTHQSITEVKLESMQVEGARLWSPGSPSLYGVKVSLFENGELLDSAEDSFGIRSIEYSPDFGFKLNGEKIFLQGVSDHHDLGALGAASFEKGAERLMLQLKSFGFNAIRCSHNPYSDSFMRLADRVGILVVDELIDKWSDDAYWGGRRNFTDLWPSLITEWIKRDRNRASVVLWSLGNELQMREDLTGFKGMNDWGITTYRVFDQVVKRWDRTRPTTVAMYPSRSGAISRHDADFNTHLCPPELSLVTEVASFNYQSARYKDYKKYAPHLNILQSEAETSALLEPYLNMDRDHSVGLCYWGAVEYWGESNAWPKKGWNYSFFDHCLQAYPQAYLVRSAFLPDSPVVRIGVVDAGSSESINWNDVQVGKQAMDESWNHPEGSLLTLFTFSNAESVELVVNSRSLGIRQVPKDNPQQANMIRWDNVPYGKGGYAEAIARDAYGKIVSRHRIETSRKASKLIVEAETPEHWKADGMDLQYIWVTAVDSRGRRVWDYDKNLSVSLEGDASIFSMDNTDHYTDTLFYGVDAKPMHKGRMLIVLRSGRLPSEVRLSCTSNGLKATIDLKTNAN